MLYDGDGVYCRFCSKEGAKVCWKCKEILKHVPEKVYEKIRSMAPDELIALKKHLGIED